MTFATHSLVTETFVPMLESLSGILDKAEAHGAASGQDLINARLAPDMYPFAKQVGGACGFARSATSRLSGGERLVPGEPKASGAELKAEVAEAVAFIRAVPAGAFEGAERRDYSMELPSGMVLSLDANAFVFAFTLPNFYFHLVTAYGILRNHGVDLGKQDYMSGVASLMRPKTGGLTPASA